MANEWQYLGGRTTVSNRTIADPNKHPSRQSRVRVTSESLARTAITRACARATITQLWRQQLM
jgi:hypothetical protein